jgi:hypothetical protein
MHTPFIDLKECRVRQASAFAQQFNKFQWKDLCFYQGFLTLMDYGLDMGDLFPAQTFAKDRLRKPFSRFAG